MPIELRLLREFRRPPTHGDHGHAGLGPCIVGRDEQVGKIVRGGFDQQDVRPRGHGVGPLDVHGDLDRPIGVYGGKARAAVLIHLGQRRAAFDVELRQIELRVENAHVGGKRRVVEGVDDGDGLARAVGRGAALQRRQAVEAVGVADLGGREGLLGRGRARPRRLAPHRHRHRRPRAVRAVPDAPGRSRETASGELGRFDVENRVFMLDRGDQSRSIPRCTQAEHPERVLVFGVAACEVGAEDVLAIGGVADVEPRLGHHGRLHDELISPQRPRHSAPISNSSTGSVPPLDWELLKAVPGTRLPKTSTEFMSARWLPVPNSSAPRVLASSVNPRSPTGQRASMDKSGPMPLKLCAEANVVVSFCVGSLESLYSHVELYFWFK